MSKESKIEPSKKGYGYRSPDTGLEWSEQHPVKSGECPDATDIRRMTYLGFLKSNALEIVERLSLEVRKLSQGNETKTPKQNRTITLDTIIHSIDDNMNLARGHAYNSDYPAINQWKFLDRLKRQIQEFSGRIN